jgi:hypothetical protein
VLALGIPKRRLREALQALVVEHGQPVGSHPVHGVFLCQDAVDFSLAQECLWQEALPTMRRRGALARIQREREARAAGEAGLPVQAGLFDGRPELACRRRRRQVRRVCPVRSNEARSGG